ncbi:MAG: hypothetical protein V9F82_14175 [Dermatophilaceae bacterium]
MYVVTADQVGSRRHADRVPAVLHALSALPRPPAREFERTAGDEIQGVADKPESVLEIVTTLLRDGPWRIGVGIGPVDLPLPRSPREGSGPAFVAAREAVRAARPATGQLATRWRLTDDKGAQGSTPRGAHARHTRLAEDALVLYARLLRTRSAEGWAVVDLLEQGHSQRAVAHRLAITPSAVSQRLRRAGWVEQGRAAELAVHHLARADGRPAAGALG